MPVFGIPRRPYQTGDIEKSVELSRATLSRQNQVFPRRTLFYVAAAVGWSAESARPGGWVRPAQAMAGPPGQPAAATYKRVELARADLISPWKFSLSRFVW